MRQTAGAKQQLQDAFELFSQVSERLAGSYAVLQHKVAGLKEELAAVHTERPQLLATILSLDNEVPRNRRLAGVDEMTVRLVHQIRPRLVSGYQDIMSMSLSCLPPVTRSADP